MRSVVLLVLALVATRAEAAAPVQPRPVLRIETGGHTAPIHHISVDRSGRWLLTVSADRTARVWDLEAKTLAPARILRVQIGAGSEGSIYAGAISPDGKTVVLSAVTSTNALYVIDRATGKIVKYLPDLPETGIGLSYSKDGKRLAVTSRHGVLVFETAKWTTAFDDAYYGASYSADFDDQGRLVTTSYDGSIRTYDQTGKALFSTQASAGKRAQEARFSPDGSQIAVGFADANGISLFSGKDMAFIRSPDMFSLSEGAFQAVAWARDGGSLLAAGTAKSSNWKVAPGAPRTGDSAPRPKQLTEAGSSFVIRAWNKAGAGDFVDYKPPVTDTILDLATRPDGSVAYASADASWGVISGKGELAREFSPATAQFIGMRLRLSPDGKAVRFAYQRGGRDLGSFSVKELKLYPTPPQDTRWIAPDERPAEKGMTKPPPKKMPLPIGPREVVRAMSSSSNEGFFVFGTDVALRSVDQKGNVRWEGTVPASVRAVNVSSDDKLAVVAYADGTIRWHRAADGAPLLTLFPHADTKRWVAYTPSGYYADSVGGDQLIRFVENKGPDKLPVESTVARFAARFHRPDVVSRILDTLDEGQAVAEADAAKASAPKVKSKR